MYSYQDRMKPVQLYIENGHSLMAIIRELGYPSRGMLARWYKEYQENGYLHHRYEKKPNFTQEQKQVAVDYYLEHGRCLRRTIRFMGYPSTTALMKWIDDLAPGQRKISMTDASMVQFSEEQKKDAVVALWTRSTSADAVAEERGTTRSTIYKWRRRLLSGEQDSHGKTPQDCATPSDQNELMAELKPLQKQVRSLQLEIDILNRAADELKKAWASIRKKR